MIFSRKKLKRAFFLFSQGKENQKGVREFLHCLSDNLNHIFQEIFERRWKKSIPIVFFLQEPKIRKIEAAPIKDRIVHRALYEAIAHEFEKKFILDSFACRPKKGVLAATIRLREFFRAESQNYSRPVFFLKCDIQKFFDSIDHQLLFRMFSKQIKRSCLFSDEEKDEIFFITRKILFGENNEKKGIPIGNLTSQFFANFFLNTFDYFVKKKLKAKKYLRYMDDFIVVSHNRLFLESLILPMECFLEKKLRLKIHPKKKKIFSGKSGIDFLGFFLRSKYTLLRFSTKKRMFRRLQKKTDEDFQKSVVGYFGYACRSDEQKTLRDLWRKAFPEKKYRDYRRIGSHKRRFFPSSEHSPNLIQKIEEI